MSLTSVAQILLLILTGNKMNVCDVWWSRWAVWWSRCDDLCVRHSAGCVWWMLVTSPLNHTVTVNTSPPQRHCQDVTTTQSLPTPHHHTVTADTSPPHRHCRHLTTTPSLPTPHYHTVTANTSPPHRHCQHIYSVVSSTEHACPPESLPRYQLRSYAI